MTTYLKHKDGQPAKKRGSKQAPETSVAVAIDGLASVISTYVTDVRDGNGHHYSDSSEICEPLEAIAHSLKSYNVNACDGNNSLNLFTGEDSHPMRLVLEGDAVDSIADSLKRIADALTAKKETL